MSNPRARGLILGATVFSLVQAGPALAGVHTIQPGAKLHQAPSAASKVLSLLDHNQTLLNINHQGPWLKVRTQTGRIGYVHQRSVSRVWIKVYKRERRLYLVRGDRVEKTYRIALSPRNPLGDKVRQGDSATPEGRCFICEMIPRPRAARYGARSMRLSYPNIEDARRGLRQKFISYRNYRVIVRAIRAGRMPPQNTRLGGSIRIHGGGSNRDWTLGCIAMDDKDVIDLYARVRQGVRVEVFRSAAQARRLNAPGYLSRLVLAGARAQVAARAYYSSRATAEYRLKYPGGDIRSDWAVCTDVIIRALRRAGIDLQAVVHEDALVHPRRYRRWIRRLNANIDHRRTRNLQIFLSGHALVLPTEVTKKTLATFQPGDIVTLDTGIRNGTVFDHIGIVAGAKDARGVPLVINIWTVGYRTSAMSLLGHKYPRVVGHFRLTHPLDYQ